jgi:hypothetical protein
MMIGFAQIAFRILQLGWILKRPEDRIESGENRLAQNCEGQSKLIETVAFAWVFAEIVRQW